ncbi:MAG: hypothetical protein GY926_01065 [bacterium]|nr:hypothetical protein [bacterium]
MVVSGLKDFQSAFERTEEHELDPVAILTAARVESDDLVCTIDIVVNGEARSRWLARFGGVVENCLTVGDWFMPDVHTTHPLLLDHLESGAELYFSRRPTDTNAVLGALAAAHKAVLGNWRPMGRYLNPLVATDALLDGGNGKLAAGPITLIREMVELTSGSLRTSTVDTGVPKRRNVQESTFEEIGEVVLFLSSEAWDSYPSEPRHCSYAIATSCSIVPAGQTDT